MQEDISCRPYKHRKDKREYYKQFYASKFDKLKKLTNLVTDYQK